MPARRRQRLARLLLWITPALWSSNCVIARASEGVIAPHALALGRWTLALLLMLPLAGVVFVVAPGDLALLRSVRFTVGDLWVLAAAISWAACTVLLQRSCWPRCFRAICRTKPTSTCCASWARRARRWRCTWRQSMPPSAPGGCSVRPPRRYHAVGAALILPAIWPATHKPRDNEA